MHTKFWLDNMKGRDHSEYLCIEGKGVPLHAMEAHGGRGGITPTYI
jgi:hypothetical protein